MVRGKGCDVVLLRPEEAGEQLRVSRTTIFSLLAAGKLESIKIGKRRLIPAEAVQDFIERERAAQAAEIGR